MDKYIKLHPDHENSPIRDKLIRIGILDLEDPLVLKNITGGSADHITAAQIGLGSSGSSGIHICRYNLVEDMYHRYVIEIDAGTNRYPFVSNQYPYTIDITHLMVKSAEFSSRVTGYFNAARLLNVSFRSAPGHSGREQICLVNLPLIKECIETASATVGVVNRYFIELLGPEDSLRLGLV